MREQYNRIKDVVLEKAGLIVNDVNRKLPLYKIYESFQQNFKDVTSTEIAMAKLLDELIENYIANADFKTDLLEKVGDSLENLLTDLRYEQL